MITNGKPKDDASVVASFTDLAHDVVELAELQGRLLKLDVVASWQKMRAGVVLLGACVCLLLGCVPILWLVIAEALVEYAGWPRTPALAVALAIGVAVGSVVGATAWIKLRTMFASFERSREEMDQSIRWIKTSLKRESGMRRSVRQGDSPLPK